MSSITCGGRSQGMTWSPKGLTRATARGVNPGPLSHNYFVIGHDQTSAATSGSPSVLYVPWMLLSQAAGSSAASLLK